MFRNLALLSFYGYALATAATLTVYGSEYFGLRWVFLAAFAITGCLAWTTARNYQPYNLKITPLILGYLALTGISIILSVSAVYSALRWGTHALMILGLVVFLRGSIKASDVDRFLFLLKVLLGITMIASYLWPAPITVYDMTDLLNRGIMGNANTFGQLAAVSALLFCHGYLTQPTRWRATLEGALGIFCVGLVWSSASRSAAVLLFVGVITLILIYRAFVHNYVAVALSLSVFLILAFPGAFSRFIFKWSDLPQFKTELTTGRAEIWSQSLDGFQERPITGWGFGADANFNLSAWTDQWSALAVKGRDTVSDFLFIVEGTGLCGVVGYVLLLAVVFHARPNRFVQSYLSRLRMQNDSATSDAKRRTVKNYDHHSICFAVSLGQLACFQIDNTALSAGNFLSVSFWIFVTANLVSWNAMKCMIGNAYVELGVVSPANVRPIRSADQYVRGG